MHGKSIKSASIDTGFPREFVPHLYHICTTFVPLCFRALPGVLLLVPLFFLKKSYRKKVVYFLYKKVLGKKCGKVVQTVFFGIFHDERRWAFGCLIS